MCRVCGSARLFDVLHWPEVPSNSGLFLPTPEEAQAHPSGSFRLVGCHACGTLFNADADATLIEYSERSLETQSWSPHFNEFAVELAAEWVRRYDLAGKTTLEIGCGREARFLELLCSLTGGPGVGIDPVVDTSAGTGLRLVPEHFDRSFVDLDADAVVCRHTLEHVVDVAGFLDDLRGWAARHPGAVHLFEVPDVERIMRETAFWDLYYEHANYFTACSLRAAFSLHGFAVEDVRLAYDDQYLVLAARPGRVADDRDSAHCGSSIHRAAMAFSGRVERAVSAAASRLRSIRAEGPLVLWQAGSKAAGLLAATGGAHLVTALVDVNPRKHGTFLVGSGLPVVDASALRDIRPSYVVLMNEVYLDEVRDQLHEQGVDCVLVTARDLLVGEPDVA